MNAPSICLIGYGLIGKTIKHYLTELGYHVSVFDKAVNGFDCKDSKKLYYEVGTHDAVIAATPYFVNFDIAKAASDTGKHYFDLTEDVETTKSIKTIPFDDSVCMSQCGLAPGAVGIIAAHLAKEFTEIHEIKMCVGALPITASNQMKYYLSWSSDGLVNEYMNPCPAVINKQQVMLQPLEGYETFNFDGSVYEAFNTSGGIGSLHHEFLSAKKVVYKTIRYPGHMERIKFLVEDLGLSKDKMVELFNAEVPHNNDDVVLIFVDVTGKIDGKPQRRSYFKKIYGDDLFSAIQRTTAAGVVSVVHALFQDDINPLFMMRGHLSNLTVDFQDFVGNPYGKMFSTLTGSQFYPKRHLTKAK